VYSLAARTQISVYTADTDLCPCGDTQTMSHIVEFCPLTKLNGCLSRLHSTDEEVSWLTNYASWHLYEKKKNRTRFMRSTLRVVWRCTIAARLLIIKSKHEKLLLRLNFQCEELCDKTCDWVVDYSVAISLIFFRFRLTPLQRNKRPTDVGGAEVSTLGKSSEFLDSERLK